MPYEQTDKLDHLYKRKPSFVTHYRGILMVLTCTAIFAVDFNIFPHRFQKTNHYGTSLMDVGVGMIVFGGGIIEGRKKGKQRIFSRSQVVTQVLLFIIGLGRLYLLKLCNYQHDVKEYGVHWNFFFTLWAVMWTTSLIRRCVWW